MSKNKKKQGLTAQTESQRISNMNDYDSIKNNVNACINNAKQQKSKGENCK